MAKVLVVYHSASGHIAQLAQSVAVGARAVKGTHVDVRRIPESNGAVDGDDTPYAAPNDLIDYDAVIFGTPSHFGNMSAAMRTFMDQTSGLWMRRALVGKLAGVFVGTSSQHGGHETTVQSFHTTLLHHGMILVGVPYTCDALNVVDTVEGGSPYGAGTITGIAGRTGPSEIEKAVAKFQGHHIAEIASRLFPS